MRLSIVNMKDGEVPYALAMRFCDFAYCSESTLICGFSKKFGAERTEYQTWRRCAGVTKMTSGFSEKIFNNLYEKFPQRYLMSASWLEVRLNRLDFAPMCTSSDR